MKQVRFAFSALFTAVLLTVTGISQQPDAAICHPDNSDPKKFLFCDKYSPIYESGAGKDFSSYYSLKSDPAPAGYKLITAAFWLVDGPHPCSGTESSAPRNHPEGRGKPGGVGSWADCYEANRDDSTVEWKFAFQGDYVNDDSINIPGGIGGSTKARKIQQRAHLVTRYVKVASN
jgi:hypothetical protein